MIDNFTFSTNTDEEFVFDMYDHVPVGEHTAIIKDVSVEKGKATRYGIKDRYTVVFDLCDVGTEFYYWFDESKSDISKFQEFRRMVCHAFGKPSVSFKEMIDQKVVITIGLEPHFKDPDKMVTKIKDIQKGGDVIAQ